MKIIRKQKFMNIKIKNSMKCLPLWAEGAYE